MMLSLTQFEAVLEKALASVVPRLEIGLEKVGQLAQSLAAEYPGTYQSGWAPLAESTLKDKTAKGYPVPSPLKRTGEMAGSYKKELVAPELAVVIGSPDKKTVWQEMGTSRGIPPRPVCENALKNSMPYAKDVFTEIAVTLLKR